MGKPKTCVTHFIVIFALLWQSGIKPSMSSRWACISFTHFYFSLFNFSNCSGGWKDSKCLLWAFLDHRGWKQTLHFSGSLQQSSSCESKAEGLILSLLLPNTTLTEISGPGQSLWRVKGRNASWEEALEGRAGVGRSARHPGSSGPLGESVLKSRIQSVSSLFLETL